MTDAAAVDDYLSELFVGTDADLDGALRASAAAGLPEIAVAPPQGKLLTLLAKVIRARRVLEVGTLGGYSAICLARALPADGALISCEIDAGHAAVARANLELAGLSGVPQSSPPERAQPYYLRRIASSAAPVSCPPD